MNLKFIESRKAGYKVVEFRGVGVVDKEIIDSKGECDGRVSVVAEEHRGGGFRVAVFG
jgi:hypothetical protein